MLQRKNNDNKKARIKERSQTEQNKTKYLLKDKSVDDAFCGKNQEKKKKNSSVEYYYR